MSRQLYSYVPTDHRVICRFRNENREGFKEVFTKVLVMAQEMGYLKKIGNISVDRTEIHANADKHRAVSCKRAVQIYRRSGGGSSGTDREGGGSERSRLISINANQGLR
jgi:hypothetical protein